MSAGNSDEDNSSARFPTSAAVPVLFSGEYVDCVSQPISAFDAINASTTIDRRRIATWKPPPRSTTSRPARIRSDNSISLQAFELGGADSDRGEYFGIVFAEFGRASHWPIGVGGGGHLDRSAGYADWTAGGIVTVEEHSTLCDFRIRDHFLDRSDWRAGDSRLDQSLDHRVASL